MCDLSTLTCYLREYVLHWTFVLITFLNCTHNLKVIDISLNEIHFEVIDKFYYKLYILLLTCRTLLYQKYSFIRNPKSLINIRQDVNIDI